MAGFHLFETEAQRVEDAFRHKPHDGHSVLNEILCRSHSLSGAEKTAALDFAALLVTRLRQRDDQRPARSRLRIWGV